MIINKIIIIVWLFMSIKKHFFLCECVSMKWKSVLGEFLFSFLFSLLFISSNLSEFENLFYFTSWALSVRYSQNSKFIEFKFCNKKIKNEIFIFWRKKSQPKFIARFLFKKLHSKSVAEKHVFLTRKKKQEIINTFIYMMIWWVWVVKRQKIATMQKIQFWNLAF